MKNESTGDLELDKMLGIVNTAAEDFADDPEELPGKDKTGRYTAGNQFWKKRAKHGRDKLFETPELMLEAAYEYFQDAKDNPWYKTEVKVVSGGAMFGSEVQQVQVPTATPFSLVGLCLYIGCNEAYFRQFKADKVKCTVDFSTVISEIENIIEKQQFEGAAVGVFNANIIARKLGLVDKKDITTDGEKLPGTVISWGGKEIKV